MLRVRVDNSGWKRRLKQMSNALPVVRRRTTIAIAGEVMREVSQTAPRDTNRYANGWAMAANPGTGAGVTIVPVLPLREAKWRGPIIARLEKQVAFWERVVERYERTQPTRHDKWRRQADRNLAKARLQLERALATEAGAVLAIGLFATNKLVTVRHKVYGGTGRIISFGGRTIVQLHNREPHSTLVEYRFHTVANAMAKVRGQGFRKFGRRWVADLVKAAGQAA